MYRRSWHSDHVQDGGEPVQGRQHRVQQVRVHPDEQPGRRGDLHGYGYEAQREGDAPAVDDPGRRGRPDGGRLRRGRRGTGRGARLVRPGRVRGGHVHPLRPDDPHRRPDDHVREPGGRRRPPRLRPQAGVDVARLQAARPLGKEETRCTRRTARSTSWWTATCTTGMPPRTTGCPGRSSTPRAGSNASTPTWAWARRRRTGPWSTSRSTPRTT